MDRVKFSRTHIAATLAGVYAVFPFAAGVQADTYPNRAIRLIVPFPPGGQTDNVSRLISNAVSPILGQQMVIDNRGGAAGTIGSTEAARADPDGYTIVMGTASTHAINPTYMSKIAYDAVKDFEPIIAVGTGPMTINVHPVVPARTLKQLIADAKAHPGRYLYGHAGVGSINHLGGEIFKTQAGGLQIVHVPYKGAGPAVSDLIGGQIPMTCSSLSSVLPHHRAGRVRTLAVLKEERSAGAPDIPTAIESGVDGAIAYTFNIFLAPAKTPPAVVNRLSSAISQVMATPEFAKSLIRIGVDPILDSNPQKAAALLRTEIARYKPIIHALARKN